MFAKQAKFAAFAVTVVISTAVPAHVAGAAPTRAASSSGTIHAVIASTGKRLDLPANWQSLSVGQLAKYGLVPGIQPPTGARSVATLGASSHAAGGHARAASIQPDSSSGWSGSVFISLTGSGLHVNERYTQTAEIPQAICTFAVFWAPANEVWETGKEICSDHSYYYWYYTDIYFGYTTEVCNSWVSVGGKPCEEVHP